MQHTLEALAQAERIDGRGAALHIRWEAFESAWTRLRARKAPGLDGIPGEVMAALAEDQRRALYQAMRNRILGLPGWVEDQPDWTTMLMFGVPKGGISVTSAGGGPPVWRLR